MARPAGRPGRYSHSLHRRGAAELGGHPNLPPTAPQRECIREKNQAGYFPAENLADSRGHCASHQSQHLATWLPARPPLGLLRPDLQARPAVPHAGGCWHSNRHAEQGEQGRPQTRWPSPRATCPAPWQAGTLYSRWQPCGLEKVSPVNPGLHRSQRSPCTCSLHTHWPVTGSQGAPGTAPSGSHSQAARQRRRQRGRQGKQSIRSTLWFKSLPTPLPGLRPDTSVKLFQPPCASVCASIKWGDYVALTGLLWGIKQVCHAVLSHSVASNSRTPRSSPPGSSVHGLLQTRILDWVVYPFSRGSSQLKNRTTVSSIAGRFFGIHCNVDSPALLAELPGKSLACVRQDESFSGHDVLNNHSAASPELGTLACCLV